MPPGDDSYYDQIAWFTTRSGALIDLTLRSGGNFDYQPTSTPTPA